MIIQCENCSRNFIAKDSDIPKEGRTVQCGYCSVTWLQMPAPKPTIKIYFIFSKNFYFFNLRRFIITFIIFKIIINRRVI